MIDRAHAAGSFGRNALVSYALPLAVMGAGAIALGRLTLEPQSLRMALLATLVLLVLGAAFMAPRATLYGLVVWLAALGLVRRIVSTYSPPGEADPLLLLGPLTLGVLVAVAASRGAFRDRTALSNAVLVLSGLILIGALNPLQGSLMAGVAGLLFMLVPTLAFWIGRGLCDDETLRRLLRLVAGLAVLAATYGLLQTFRGFPSWDESWIAQAERSGYAALYVHAEGGESTIRPFASFSSASGYVVFVAIGLVIVLGLGLKRQRWILVAPTAGLLAVALIYGSSRAIVVAVVAALAFMAALRRRQSLGVTIVGVAIVLLLLPLTLRAIVPGASGSSGAGTLVAHQTQGLSDPLNPDSSTAGLHVLLIVRGLRAAFTEPLGLGTGVVNIASTKFGKGIKDTESDPSNVAVALGLPGLLAYGAVFALGFGRAYRVTLMRRDRLSLVVFGLLFVTVFQWLAGGNYAVAFIPWLLLGWLDSAVIRSSERGDSRVCTY